MAKFASAFLLLGLLLLLLARLESGMAAGKQETKLAFLQILRPVRGSGVQNRRVTLAQYNFVSTTPVSPSLRRGIRRRPFGEPLRIPRGDSQRRRVRLPLPRRKHHSPTTTLERVKKIPPSNFGHVSICNSESLICLLVPQFICIVLSCTYSAESS